MSIGDLLAIEVIAVVGVLLLIGTIIPGVRLYWPRHTDPVSRSDLGVALMGGALIAFAVLGLQLMIQFRSQADADARKKEADRQALLLELGGSSDLSGFDLREEDLSGAYLRGKILHEADLRGADIEDARLQDAVLVGADLRDADLGRARLERADLRYANLTRAKLPEASMHAVKLDSAILFRADLSGADLSDSWLRADLRAAMLHDADLGGARLGSAILTGAVLTGSDLEFADLRGADLRGADLRGSTLLAAKDVSYAKYDAKTKWPDGFAWPPNRPLKREVLTRCAKPTGCELPPTDGHVADLPEELLPMRAKLERATDPADLEGLPGWWVGERGPAVDAHAPGERALFTVSVDDAARGSSAKDFSDDRGETNACRIEGVTVKGASNAYAHTFDVDDEEGQGRSYVGVYFVNGTHAYRMWASAPDREFALFQPDFEELFELMGVTGTLFPVSRGGEDRCVA